MNQHKRILAGISRGSWLIGLIFVIMLMSMLNTTFAGIGQDLFRVCREALMLVIMGGMFLAAPKDLDPRLYKRFVSVGLLLSIGALTLVIIQAYFIPRLIFITLPREWFIQNEGTIAGELDLIYSLIRPSATYGEPSYLGLILLSLIVMVMPVLFKSRKAQMTFAICIAVGLLSRSAAFLIATVFILTAQFAQPGLGRRERDVRTIIVGVALACAIAVPFFTGLADRFDSVGQGADASAQLRIFEPLLILPRFLMSYPAGLPINTLFNVLPTYSSTDVLPLDNAIANFFFEFGLAGGLLILGFFILGQRSRIIAVYAFCSMNFNGAFLAVDKAAIWVLTLAIYDLAQAAAAASAYTVESSSRTIASAGVN